MRKKAKATTTTPDPEFSIPKPKIVEVPPPPVLGGENARGEAAGCPTGLADSGEGVPGTGAANPSVPFSLGEGISEEQPKRPRRKKG